MPILSDILKNIGVVGMEELVNIEEWMRELSDKIAKMAAKDVFFSLHLYGWNKILIKKMFILFPCVYFYGDYICHLVLL